jgi:hypothetical protein
MTTDELIAALATSPEPAPKTRLVQRLTIAVLGGLLLGFLGLAMTLGFRADIGIAAPVVAMKAGFSALIATVAGGLALRLAKPIVGETGSINRIMAPLVTVVCGALAIGALVLFATTPGARMLAFTGGGFPWCVLLIPALGLPTTGLLLWALKEAAPTKLALAGAAVGAFSGGIGAMIYAMYCPVDSVAFVTIWYVAGIAVASVLGAFIGVRLLRW